MVTKILNTSRHALIKSERREKRKKKRSVRTSGKSVFLLQRLRASQKA